MEPPAFQVIYSVLAIVAVAGSVALAITWMASARVDVARTAREIVHPWLVPLAWLVAVVATTGSLYFSEVANYEPCRWCWFQRIAIYPLSVMLLVGWIRHDRGVYWYVLPISVIGAVFATYHYYIEWNPESDTCGFPVPCTFVWFRRFGFVSLPFMALCGFVSISILMLLASRGSRTKTPS